MNYWLCTTEYPPFFGGGISTYCKNTVDLFLKYKNNITVIVFDPNLNSQSNIQIINKKNNLRIVRFNITFNSFYQNMGFNQNLSYRFSEVIELLIKKDKRIPDVIEFQDYLGIGYYSLIRKYSLEDPFSKIKFITTIHSPIFLLKEVNLENIYKFPEFWIGEMEKFQIKASDGVIFPSIFIKNQILNRLKIQNYKVTRNPISIPKLNQNNKTDIDKKERLIYFGRLEYRKGIYQFLKILKKIDLLRNLKIDLFGRDTFFPVKNISIKKLIEKEFSFYIQNENIRIFDSIPPKNLIEKMSFYKAVVLPSVFESLPYAVLESMLFKKCVLTTPYGGQGELIENGKNGFIFDLTEEGIFQTFKKFLSLDNKEIKKIGENASQTVLKNFDNKKIYEEKINFIKNINRKLINYFPFYSNDFNKVNIKLEKNPLLSIIIPYYNAHQYIEETIKSILKSFYKNKEIIIVDDGSDNYYSIKKLKEIKNKYPQVKIVHKENGGLASARNFGAFHASGKIIAFLDADDKIHKEYYSSAIKILKNYKNVAFVYSWTNYIEKNNGYYITYATEFPYSLIHNPTTSGSLVIYKEIFEKFGKNDERFIFGMEDYDMIINLLENNFGGISIPKALFYYRVRDDSMARQFNYFNLNYLYSLLFKKHKNLYQKYIVEALNLINSNGPAYTFDNPSWETTTASKLINKKEIDLENNNSIEPIINPAFKQKIKIIINKSPIIKKLIYKITEKIK